ncbi:GH36-type glycosyl hydrolase domain-containing protein, partial [Ralstonia pseudosolanacearum]|uniref:GH36-type glycosyl hydrolase domain-containing protein n=1 Tax=Ralstonia pseudosolanacearum TaxID=1310165 RepID=UPI003CE96212
MPHAEPEGCKMRILQLLNGVTTAGYGLHLFDPAWFEGKDEEKDWSPTVIPTAEGAKRVHGLKDACADDALWLIPAIVEYVRETGDLAFLD